MSDNEAEDREDERRYANQYVQSEELPELSHPTLLGPELANKLRRTLQHREDLVLERVSLEHTIATLRESLKKAESVMNSAKEETRDLEQLERQHAEDLEANTKLAARLDEARHILTLLVRSGL